MASLAQSRCSYSLFSFGYKIVLAAYSLYVRNHSMKKIHTTNMALHYTTISQEAMSCVH